MYWTLRKWRAIFSIYFQDGLAYRASGIIWILTDLTTAVTMPLVWARSAGVGQKIAGFSSSDFVLYYLCMLLLGSFVTSHIMWELAMEIKEGQFSTMLLRPVSFMQFTFIRNLTWRVIRTGLFAPFCVALLFIYKDFLGEAHVSLSWQFWSSLVLGHLVSFSFVTMMAMIALFTQEVNSLFELYYVPMLFLSGQLFPVALMPDWVRILAKIFPFYYTTGAPTEILIGRLSGTAATQAIMIQLAWITGALLMGRFLWAKGLKHYSGVGM